MKIGHRIAAPVHIIDIPLLKSLAKLSIKEVFILIIKRKIMLEINEYLMCHNVDSMLR